MEANQREDRRPRLHPPTLSEIAGEDAIDRVFNALANPKRRQILALLHDWGGFMSSADFATRIGGPWSSISRHLSVLTEAGLIRCDVRKNERAYTLAREQIQSVPGRWINRVASNPTWLPDGSIAFDFAD